jgi:hypothetical protein
MKSILLAVLVLALVGLAAPALAQTVTNPTTAVITVGPDHAQITRYELGWFIGAAVDPVQVADIGTGPLVSGELAKPIPSYPIGVTYTAKVRGYVNLMASAWSPASNPFFRTPAPPLGLVVR